MNFAKCPICGREVAGADERCPACGEDLRNSGLPAGRKNGCLRVAKGIIAIGQFAFGVVTFAQFGIGLLFGFGQVILGATAVAQVAVALIFGLGQFATGCVAIGQIGLGYYALGQAAFGVYRWTSSHCDPQAQKFFPDLLRLLGL